MKDIPANRADFKGELTRVKSDFEWTVKGEITNGDCFPPLDVKETDAYREYKDILTMQEMQRLYKAVLKNA